MTLCIKNIKLVASLSMLLVDDCSDSTFSMIKGESEVSLPKNFVFFISLIE